MDAKGCRPTGSSSPLPSGMRGSPSIHAAPPSRTRRNKGRPKHRASSLTAPKGKGAKRAAKGQTTTQRPSIPSALTCTTTPTERCLTRRCLAPPRAPSVISPEPEAAAYFAISLAIVLPSLPPLSLYFRLRPSFLLQGLYPEVRRALPFLGTTPLRAVSGRAEAGRPGAGSG